MSSINLETLQEYIANSSLIPSLEIDIFKKIPSTNQKLWELIAQNYSLPRAAIALQQTAGRGQWGRRWESPTGGLYLSVGIPLNLSVKCAPHLTLAVAWGIANKLRSLGLPILLKWPNDLVLHGHKLGGIKIETRVCQEMITQAVIGVGINYTNPVPSTGINLESISITLEQLALLTMEGIFSGYSAYLREGITTILDSYHQLLSNLGQKITYNQTPGTILGVNHRGELRIRLFSPGASVEICLQPGKIRLGYCEEILKKENSEK